MADEKPSVMVVDDDATNISVVENAFTGLAFDVRSVSKGYDAIKLALELRPDIVLLDVMMPDMDGYEICRRIRADDCLRYTKIIMVSARALVEERLKGYAAGANDYVTKPFDTDELLAKVNSAVRLRFNDEVENLKKRLLRVMSHEIRTPLNGIMGFATLLQNSPVLRNDETMYLSRIMEASDALLRTSDKYILLYELNKDGEMSQSSCVVDELIKKAMEEAHDQANKKQVRFVLSSMGMIEVMADPALLAKAFELVIDNAALSSPEGGEVEISVRQLGARCLVGIRDKGEAISPSMASRIFDEFISGDVVMPSRRCGVSLAVARKIARRHGGDLVLSSSGPEGSSFVFDIPCFITDLPGG